MSATVDAWPAGGFELPSGHVTMVTGGNSGIGLGISRAMAAAGADVAIIGTSRERNEAAVAGMRDLGRGRFRGYVCDVADEAAVVETTAAVVRELGTIDSVFTCAAVPSAGTRFIDMSGEEWRRVLTINLDGTFHTFREVARHMVQHGVRGSLVAVASLAAVHGQARGQQYAASKGGVVSLMRSCAVELARHGIRANAVLPGSFTTPMSEAFLDSPQGQRLVRRIPVRRSGDPAEIGGVAVYLAGPWSSYHTGDTLVVDGGYSVY